MFTERYLSGKFEDDKWITGAETRKEELKIILRKRFIVKSTTDDQALKEIHEAKEIEAAKEILDEYDMEIDMY